MNLPDTTLVDRRIRGLEPEDVFPVEWGCYGAAGNADFPARGAMAGDGVDDPEGLLVGSVGKGAPIVAREGKLEVPAGVEGARRERGRGGSGAIEADDGAVGQLAEPGIGASGPVGALDLMQGLGGVVAVFLVAELPNLFGALAKTAVVAGGEEQGECQD